MTTLLIVGVILLLFLWYVLTPRKKDKEGHKMWNFDEKSWHARYYKWVFYGKLPQGGCEYFWIMLALTLLAPIIFTIWLFAKIVIFIRNLFPKKERKEKQLTDEQWQKKWEEEKKRFRRWEKIGAITGKAFFVASCIFFLIVIVVGIIYLFKNPSKVIPLLFALGTIVAIIGIVLLIQWIWNKYKVGSGLIRVIKWLCLPFRYIGSMIVAIYNNSCPKITWKNSEGTPEDIEPNS